MSFTKPSELPAAPLRGDSNFSANAEAFLLALVNFVPEISTLSDEMWSAAHLFAVTATSATSRTIGTGATTFEIEADKGYLAGHMVQATSRADTNNWMRGIVTSYSGTTLTVNVTQTNGSGTAADWDVIAVVIPDTIQNADGSNTSTADQLYASRIGFVQRPRFERSGATVITLTGGCAYEIGGAIVSTDQDITYTVTGLSSSTAEWHYLYIVAGSTTLTSSDLLNSTTAPTWSASKQGWYDASGNRCIFAFFNTGNGVVLDFTDGGRGLIYLESEQPTNVINTDVDTSWVTVQLLLPVFAQEAFVFFFAYGSGETKTYYWRRYGNTGNGSYLFQQVSGATEILRGCAQSDAQGRGQIRSNVAGTNLVSVVQVGYTLPLRGI